MSIKNVLTKAAIPYAEALFDFSQSTQLVQKNYQDLQNVLSGIRASENLSVCLASPLISINDKKKVLNSLFLDKVSSTVLNFLFILIERRRIHLIEAIINYYGDLVNQLNSITSVIVYTAYLFNEEQERILKEKLEIMTEAKQIKLFIKIKPELIGGFVVKMGSKVLDLSISGQLNQISSYLNGSY
uniref:ATP synthase subunit delta n=1 Tax=Porolithon onkodes TaxID=231751 RepID=A0A2Z2L1A2_9FLOR|nr:ATP synthase subunit delta [Porolithon onkodes]ASB29764.1 ATP synthase subunit delta [Porolithon onkodes]